MGWDILDSLDSVLGTVGKAANVASAGYNIYAGINNMKQANDSYDVMAGSAKLQDDIAREQWALNKPLMQQQGALTGMEMSLAQQRMPALLNQQYDLSGQSMTQQGKDLALYDSSRGLLSKFFNESEKGLNSGIEMNRAGASVENAMAGADANNARNLARRGVSMNSGQAITAQQQSLIQKALAKAGARTNAFNMTRDTNYNRLGNAVNVRQGLNSAGAAIPQTQGISLGNPVTAAAASTATASNMAQNASAAAGQAFNEAGYVLGSKY